MITTAIFRFFFMSFSLILINADNNVYRRKRARQRSKARPRRQRQEKLIAYMSDYPTCNVCNTEDGSSETLIENFPRGTVEVQQGLFSSDIWIRLNMRGLPSKCKKEKNDYVKNGCGIHIHEGMTCSSPNLVKGHYWNKDSFGDGDENDPWIRYIGENSDSNGPAIQYDSSLRGDAIDQWIYLRGGNGFTAEENLQRAIVIHDENGVRKACGVLNWVF